MVIIIGSLTMFVASLYSFLLFHTLVELFTIIISFGIFIISWSSRKYADNAFLFFIGVSYFFIGSLDLVHTLSYKGLNIFPTDNANLPIQLWIAARYLEAFSFLGAFLILAGEHKEKTSFIIKKSYEIFYIYAIIALAIFLSIFYLDIFPEAYVEGAGITSFKIYSEYIISFLFSVSLAILFKKKDRFDREMGNLLSLALIMKIFSEMSFTHYIGVYDFSNVIGHIFRFISFLLLYKAFFEIGMDKPYKFLFSSLKASEERYKSLVEFSPDSILVQRKGDIIFANDMANKLFGMKDGEGLAGRKLIDFISSEYKSMVRERIKNIFSGRWKEAPRAEIEILRSDGKIVPVEVRGMKIIYEGAEAMVSIIRDISERRKAEKKIRSLAQFPEENPNPIMRIFRDGRVQYANKPARTMLSHFGWKEKKLIPEPLSSKVADVIRNGGKFKMELACRCGNIFNLEFAPSFTEGYVNIYGKDITDRKIAEKKLAEAQAELQKRMEMRMKESYEYMGIINRKISILLELEESFKDKKNKQEVLDYILNSAINISRAKIGMVYVIVGKNHFNLLSSLGISKENRGKLQMLSVGSAGFIGKLIDECKRLNGPCSFNRADCFDDNLKMSYFVALPLLKNGSCRGFLYLGFDDRESMDSQELEFLDVFSKHVSTALVDFKVI